MKDHYWDFRVCQWVRFTSAPPVEELLPGQRPAEPADTVAPIAGTVPLSPTP